MHCLISVHLLGTNDAATQKVAKIICIFVTIIEFAPEVFDYYIMKRCISRFAILTSFLLSAARLQAFEPDVIVDNADPSGVAITGAWTTGTATANKYGPSLLNDGNSGTNKSVRFTPTLQSAGYYQVYGWWGSNAAFSSSVPVDIVSTSGTSTINVNQQAGGGQWNLLGTFKFNAGTGGSVTVRDNGAATGNVIADAVRFSKLSPNVISDSTDTTGITKAGTWSAVSNLYSYSGTYLSDSGTGKGTKSITFAPTLPGSGDYEVSMWWPAASGLCTSLPVQIVDAAGTHIVPVDETQNNGAWTFLGQYHFASGTGARVILSNSNTTGTVVADAVRFMKVGVSETVQDNADATGVIITAPGSNPWTLSTTNKLKFGASWLNDGNSGRGNKSMEFQPSLSVRGYYDVFGWWVSDSTFSNTVSVSVSGATGLVGLSVNERLNGAGSGSISGASTWDLTFSIRAGRWSHRTR